MLLSILVSLFLSYSYCNEDWGMKFSFTGGTLRLLKILPIRPDGSAFIIAQRREYDDDDSEVWPKTHRPVTFCSLIGSNGDVEWKKVLKINSEDFDFEYFFMSPFNSLTQIVSNDEKMGVVQIAGLINENNLFVFSLDRSGVIKHKKVYETDSRLRIKVLEFLEDGSLILVYSQQWHLGPKSFFLRFSPQNQKVIWKKEINYEVFEDGHGKGKGLGQVGKVLLSDDRKFLNFFGYFGYEKDGPGGGPTFLGTVFTLDFENGNLVNSFLYGPSCGENSDENVWEIDFNSVEMIISGENYKYSKIPNGKPDEFMFRTLRFFNFLDLTKGQHVCKEVKEIGNGEKTFDIHFLDVLDDGDVLMLAKHWLSPSDLYFIKADPLTNEVKWFGPAYNQNFGRDFEEWKKNFFPYHDLVKVGKKDGFFFSENFYEIYNEIPHYMEPWARLPKKNRDLLSEIHLYRLDEEGKNQRCGIKDFENEVVNEFGFYSPKFYTPKIKIYDFYKEEKVDTNYNELFTFVVVDTQEVDVLERKDREVRISLLDDTISGVKVVHGVCDAREKCSWKIIVFLIVLIATLVNIFGVVIVMVAGLWCFSKRRRVASSRTTKPFYIESSSSSTSTIMEDSEDDVSTEGESN